MRLGTSEQPKDELEKEGNEVEEELEGSPWGWIGDKMFVCNSQTKIFN